MLFSSLVLHSSKKVDLYSRLYKQSAILEIANENHLNYCMFVSFRTNSLREVFVNKTIKVFLQVKIP